MYSVHPDSTERHCFCELRSVHCDHHSAVSDPRQLFPLAGVLTGLWATRISVGALAVRVLQNYGKCIEMTKGSILTLIYPNEYTESKPIASWDNGNTCRHQSLKHATATSLTKGVARLGGVCTQYCLGVTICRCSIHCALEMNYFRCTYAPSIPELFHVSALSHTCAICVCHESAKRGHGIAVRIQRGLQTDYNPTQRSQHKSAVSMDFQ